MADGLANNVTFSFPPEGGARVTVGVTFALAPPNLPAEVSHMLARVLARVPYADQWQISNRVLFVMLPTCGGHYLSPELVTGRSLVTFSDTLHIVGNDEYAAEVLLPQIALTVLQARHTCEPPMDMQVGTWLDSKTGKVADERKFQVAAKEYRNAGVDLQIDAHFAEKKARELADQWNAAWRAAHPAPTVEPGVGVRPLTALDFFGLGYGIGRTAPATNDLLAKLNEVAAGDATMLFTDAEYRVILGRFGEDKVAQMIAAAHDRRGMEQTAAHTVLAELRG